MNKLDELEKFYKEPTETHAGILDDFSRILEQYDATRSAADRDAMRETLKRQLASIGKELVEMRLQVHDDIAVQYFQDFKEQIRLQI